MSARWSPEQEATLLARMAEGATIGQVAGEMGKSVVNVQMKWSMIRPAVVEEKEEVAPEPSQPVDYFAELQAIKDALSALEAKLAAQKS